MNLAARLPRNVSLVLYMTYADLRAESERTYAGFLWWIAEPVASMTVYYLCFSVILDRGGSDYVSFLFAGVIPWRWFQSTILRGSAAILSSRGLMQQVYLPKFVLPLVSLLVDTFKFLVVFALMLLYFAVVGPVPGLSTIWLLPVLVAQFLLVASGTMLAAMATPFAPDLKIVLQNFLRLWFFLSGVFYELERFSPEAQEYLRLNPMAVILEAYREVLLEGAVPDLQRLGGIAVASALFLYAAIMGIRRIDYVYPKLKF